MRTRLWIAVLVPAVLALGAGVPSPAFADRSSFRAELLGANEHPIVLSDGKGRFVAQGRPGEVSFRLAYQGLEGVLQAHIHVANPWDNGDITVFLCTNLNNTPTGATARLCSEEQGTVTGTIVAADVQAAGPIPVEDLGAVVQLMRDGATYVNVHTEAFPTGELRGQVNARRR